MFISTPLNAFTDIISLRDLSHKLLFIVKCFFFLLNFLQKDLYVREPYTCMFLHTKESKYMCYFHCILLFSLLVNLYKKMYNNHVYTDQFTKPIAEFFSTSCCWSVCGMLYIFATKFHVFCGLIMFIHVTRQ